MEGGYPSLSIQELVAACARGDASAWEEFVTRTQPTVARACIRAAQCWGEYDPSVVEDLVQESYTRLVAEKLLLDFEPRRAEAVYALLKLVAKRAAHQELKRRRVSKRRGAKADLALDPFTLEGTASPALTAPSLDDQLMLQQAEAYVAGLTGGEHIDRDLLIFQLHYRLGLSAAAIASIPSVDLSVKGVESVLNRLARLARSKFSMTKKHASALGDD